VPELSCGCAEGVHANHRNMLEGAAERDERVCDLGWPMSLREVHAVRMEERAKSAKVTAGAATRPQKLRAYLERKRALIEYQLSGVIVGIPARTEMPGTPMTFAEEYALLGDLLRWMDEAGLGT